MSWFLLDFNFLLFYLSFQLFLLPQVSDHNFNRQHEVVDIIVKKAQKKYQPNSSLICSLNKSFNLLVSHILFIIPTTSSIKLQ